LLIIKDYIFSEDILEKKFKCNLPQCLGNCCRYGDSGAPLTEQEVIILENIWPEVKPYLRSEGITVIKAEGTSITDFENDLVTPLIGNEECAYAILVNNVFMCGIEKAFSDKKISFQKPVSCHLFPVRIKQYSGFRAVNYQELSICYPAIECGNGEGVYLYEFLKVPFIRAFGEETYDELCIAAEEFKGNPGRFNH
jgi:hypothetical protein